MLKESLSLCSVSGVYVPLDESDNVDVWFAAAETADEDA